MEVVVDGTDLPCLSRNVWFCHGCFLSDFLLKFTHRLMRRQKLFPFVLFVLFFRMQILCSLHVTLKKNFTHVTHKHTLCTAHFCEIKCCLLSGLCYELIGQLAGRVTGKVVE